MSTQFMSYNAVCAALLALFSVSACNDSYAPENEDPDDFEFAQAKEELIGGTEFSTTWARNTGTIAIKDTCTAALVGRRHILTAAHCAQGPAFYYNGKIQIAQVGRLTSSTQWTTVFIKSTYIHPGWTAMCLVSSCAADQTLVSPYSPDIAVVELTADVPLTFKTAVIPRTIYNYDAETYVTGYGCEISVNGAGPNPPRLKMNRAVTLPVARINDYRQEVPTANLWQFGNSNTITAGRKVSASAASLCPGDSGGPLLQSSPAADGPTYPRNRVIGVNAYYTFSDASGVSVRNIHARLYDGGVTQAWLQTVLPASSFIYE
ncbi:MAG: trypsin-like serine protease [Polyangiaceae bacterium]